MTVYAPAFIKKECVSEALVESTHTLYGFMYEVYKVVPYDPPETWKVDIADATIHETTTHDETFRRNGAWE
jgi:hypothetical protein